ncbi:discoidin domain-containing protein [Streptomyces sp. NBC_01498]|uniref:discoidin domain-containing protein n=1 Tax=Streptomyces sp. NBC_01498 TaxID=2975870 RepID=UPI002E7BA5D5|nr:discoidin domain-containing protein [Streptomyces sp. NBC_01498]WTL27042.1 discoidin domain-containing protein [Streptomyces sp. NBC_01498]
MSLPPARSGGSPPLRRTLIAALSLAVASASLAAVPAHATSRGPALTVYVAPDGKDSGKGSAGHPFKTLEHARDYVRDTKDRVNGDVHVRLLSGTHRLSRTFTLTARDSGRSGQKIVYEAAPGAHPVISGGRQVTGWTAADAGKKVYKAKLSGLDTRQLYVNGELKTRARGAKNPAGFSKTSTGYTFTDDSITGYQRPADLEVASSWGWKLMRCRVDSISGRSMTMVQPCWDNAHLQQGQEIQTPTWLENARELLDSPGEWYLDRTAGEIFYLPEPGQNMATADVTVPVVQDLVDLNGTRSNPVRNVAFEGLTFSHSTWLAPSSPDGHIEGQGGFRMVGEDNPDFNSTRLNWKKTPGAVNVSHGQNIAFEGNTFTHLGAVGLNLNTGTQRTDITGNVFRQIAATGIQIGGVEWGDAHPDDPRDITKDTRVANNVVTRVADQYNGSLGILAGYTDSTEIVHNKVYDLPYSGISVGWGWGLTDKGGNPTYPNNSGVPVSDTPTIGRDNVVANNEISDIMRSQADGGAVYTLSDNPGSRVSGNYIRGVPYAAYGAVYHDEGSRHWQNTGNAFCDITFQWLLMNHGMDSRITGNFTTNPTFSVQNRSTGNNVSGNVTVGACDQLPASIVNNAGLQKPYRHLDPGPAVTDRRAPGAPGAPTAQADFPTVADLRWPAATDDTAVTGYSVFQDGALVNASATTGVRIPGLTGGRTYTFKITARDAAGNESAPSRTLRFTMPAGRDLALRKPVTASSESEANHPDKVNDGDLSTRWAQGLGLPDPSWIQVDLGANHDIDGAITTFEKPSGYKYRVEVSPDEVHWTTFADRTATNTTAQTTYDNGTPVTGRYVRLTVTGSSGNGGSVHDLQVYGDPATPGTDHTAPSRPGKPGVRPLLPSVLDLDWTAPTDDTGVTTYAVYQDGKRIAVTDRTTLRVSNLTAGTEYAFTVVARDAALNASEPSPAATVTTPADTNLALDKSVTASSQSDGYAPSLAVDGNLSTRWAQGSGLPDPSWIQVDLGEATSVSSVMTNFELSGGYRYRLEYSTDGETWSLFDDRTAENTTSAINYSFAEHPVTARHLRLTVTGSSWNGGSIYELKVYGGF